ncbi:MAG: DNA polymerase III subunit delta [Dehalococcoidia bacterium]
MIRLWYGADTFSRQEAVAGLKAGLDSDGMLSTNTVVLDGATVSPPELRNHCNTVPFLAPTRLVVVEGLLKRSERRRGGKRDEAADDEASEGSNDGLPAWRFLREFAAEMPPTTELLLLDEDVAPTNQLVRDMKPVAEVRVFPAPGRAELPTWILARAKAKGVTISPRLAEGIGESCGNDLWALNNELEKLAVFAAAGDPPSESEMLGLLATAREQSVFALCDQIVEGRRSAALGALSRLLAEGQSPQYLLAMITRHFRLLTLARDAMDRRVPGGELMNVLETRSQYVVDKTVKQARSFTLPLLARCYRRMVQADQDTKTGIYDGELALQLLVGDLCAAAGR